MYDQDNFRDFYVLFSLVFFFFFFFCVSWYTLIVFYFFIIVFDKLSCSPRLHLFDQKYSKKYIYILKYYKHFK